MTESDSTKQKQLYFLPPFQPAKFLLPPIPIIYTIGHSTQKIEKFIELLRTNSIQVIADVRSHPRSRYAPQFDMASLKRELRREKIKYLYLGHELGGKPSDPSMYDEKGYASYYLMSKTPSFLAAIQRLVNGMLTYRVTIMCTEEDPTDCHRRLLIGRMLSERGIHILHIRGDGQLQTEEKLSKSKRSTSQLKPMLMPFDIRGDEWKSIRPIRSVSRNAMQENSSRRLRKSA